MKINYKALIVGIIAVLLISNGIKFTRKDRNIRINGKVIKAPIVEFYGRISRPNGGVTVSVDGQWLNAGSFDNRGYSIGDSIEVCYIPGEYCVVQTRMNPQRYYLFFFLEFIGLALGIYLIVAGLLGKGLNKLSEKKNFTNNTKKLSSY